VDNVQALFEFEYTQETGRVERGQVVELAGVRNDEVMLRLQYFAHVPKGAALKECGTCGKLFVSEEARVAHGKLWHGFECDGCGWVPRSYDGDRAVALQRHRQTCVRVAIARDARRAQHTKEVTAKKLTAASRDEPLVVDGG
jgi:hypothetical protein